MPEDTYTLTKDKTSICRIIDRHIEREEANHSWRYTMWSLSWYYLNGARRFDVFDPETGLMQPHHLDEDGNMEFQSQELLAAIDRVSGVLASMDARPKILRTGGSLQQVRDRSIAQVIADATISRDRADEALTDFAHILTCCGSCGIASHVVDHPTVGLTADLEVVHPRELYPFPSLAMDRTKQRGLIRERVVPMKYLEEKFGRRIKTNKEKLYYFSTEAGATPQDDTDYVDRLGNTTGGLRYSGGGGYTGSGGDPTETQVELVRIRELWLMGHRDTVSRYVVVSGDYVIMDEDFSDVEVYCPIGFARFMETGSFYGAGLFDLLFSISREMEKLLKALFNNIRDIDQYGILVLPQGQFNERAALRDVGRGLRVLPYEPDAIDPGFRPFNIAPVNSGDLPGKTAQYAKQLMDNINPFRDLVASKGRVDSAAGLGFLDEKNRQLMVTPMKSVEKAFSQAHRSTLAQAARMLTTSRRAIPINNLTLDLAGAIIDPEQSTVSFDVNPLPVITNLGITIRETSPRSEVARKQEALQLFAAPGLGDPMRFILLSLQEGLDFAIYMEEERAAYESVVKNCLILFGNGETPGEVVLTPHTALPNLQLRVLNSFMAGPAMAMSSPEVQDEFMKFKQFLQQGLGNVLPEGVPLPEEAAMQRMQEQGRPMPAPAAPRRRQPAGAR